jgi:hypothetical protein
MAALHRAAPCRACPFRTDVAPGQFSAARYSALLCTVGEPGREAPMGAPLFACHATMEGQEQICAGWLAVCGYDHLTVRYMMATGRLPRSVVDPPADWPELFPDYRTMASHQGGPNPEAVCTIPTDEQDTA